MKSVLAWIKSNPLSVGASVVAVASLVWLVMIGSDGKAFMESMSGRDTQIRRIKSLQRTLVKVPPAQPDQPERQLEIAVNQAAISQLERVYTRMNQEYREIFKLAVELNESNHVPMLEGLFPEPADASKPFEARLRYRNLIESMVRGELGLSGQARMKVSPPPAMARIEQRIKEVESQYLDGLLSVVEDVGQLSQSQIKELDALQSKKVREYLERYARSLHLYAETDIDLPDFSLDVGDWSRPGLRPRMSQIWEGQLGVWIQQDIMEAIARANQVNLRTSTVINAPVKRLIRIQVVPGYVGLTGSVGNLAGMGARDRFSGSVSTPILANDTLLPDDFSVSPTGRRSNAMYDVRQVKLSVVLDSQLMLDFLDQLRQVNFMTVTKMDLTDIDEYEAMRKGYIYGSGDAVRADMLIETIWLRDWTVAYMHESVRNMLGVFER